MQKTKIEWCDYTINPVKGLCPMGCPYCYARAMYKRFKWNPVIRFEELAILKVLYKTKVGDKIFWASTMELFGDWVKFDWLVRIYDYVSMFPSRIHIFLTKQPQNLPHGFPNNSWVGMTVTKDGIGQDSAGAIPCFEDIEAKVKFVSFEPLQERVNFECYTDFVDWVIIGQQTPVSAKTRPKPEWISEIIHAADKAQIPVFLKNNILNDGKLHWPNGENWNRQEFPVVALER